MGKLTTNFLSKANATGAQQRLVGTVVSALCKKFLNRMNSFHKIQLNVYWFVEEICCWFVWREVLSMVFFESY